MSCGAKMFRAFQGPYFNQHFPTNPSTFSEGVWGGFGGSRCLLRFGTTGSLGFDIQCIDSVNLSHAASDPANHGYCRPDAVPAHTIGLDIFKR